MTDQVANATKVSVSGGYDASATAITLATGEGAELPNPTADEYNLVWWDSTLYPDPADDPNFEIVRACAINGDTLYVTRNQEGSGASTKNTAGSTYKMLMGPTAKTITDLQAEINSDITALAAISVMDADFTADDGFMRKTGSSAYEAIKANMNASTAPGVNDDSGSGYMVASRWIDTTADKEYVCLDASSGAAVWIETTQAGGSSAFGSDTEVQFNDGGVMAADSALIWDKTNDRLGIGVVGPTRPMSISADGMHFTGGSAPGSPANGDVYYDAATNKLKVYAMGTWQNMNGL